MKRFGLPAFSIIILIMVFVLPVVGRAASVVDDTTMHKTCSYCGMDREKYNYSRMLIEYDDGTATGVCSLHCAAVDLAINLDKTPAKIKVADMISRQLIDAETAFWILGGTKPGVMTKRAKWAFAKKEDAEANIKETGAKLVTFDEAIKASYEDIYEDTKMIRERRKAKKAAMKTDHAGHQH